jgi:hypothetical protein
MYHAATSKYKTEESGGTPAVFKFHTLIATASYWLIHHLKRLKINKKLVVAFRIS